MPMIDVYAAAGTFADKHQLAADLATAVMVVEGVPDIPIFRQNTADLDGAHTSCRRCSTYHRSSTPSLPAQSSPASSSPTNIRIRTTTRTTSAPGPHGRGS